MVEKKSEREKGANSKSNVPAMKKVNSFLFVDQNMKEELHL